METAFEVRGLTRSYGSRFAVRDLDLTVQVGDVYGFLGPNGAGKTTVAAPLVRDQLGIRTFVNADVIAQGLSGFSPASSHLAAGRMMLEQIHSLAASRADFAFETTLASRTFLPWMRCQQAAGYEVLVVFVWVRSVELSIARVADRVRNGGHDVGEATIRRRYARGIHNFVHSYRKLADRWWCFDNSEARARLVSEGRGASLEISDPITWSQICP